MKKRRSKDPQGWYRTDNAGRIFASLYRWRITSVYRVSASLKEPIEVARLSRSLERVLDRFPYFKVHLRQGIFWCFFEPNPASPRLWPDSPYPCNELRYRRRESFPFRVRVFHKRIALEVAHVLTDGTGALEFLRAVVADYLGLNELESGATDGWMRPGQEPNPEEFEDAFRRYHRKGLPPMDRMERAFRIPGELETRGIRHITTGILSTSEVLTLAKAQGVTLGEFFIAAYLFSLYRVFGELPPAERRRLARPIRLDVPIDLRKRLPSKTMRNFFLPAYPEIDPRLGEYEFEEILQTAHNTMRGVLREKYFLKMIGRNVGAEQNPFLRSVPLFLKNLILPEIYTRWSLSQATSGLSNMGRATMPEAAGGAVERFDFVPAHPSTRGVSCGLISYGERLHVCFNSVLKERAVERAFFRTLTRMGLKIRLETNQT